MHSLFLYSLLYANLAGVSMPDTVQTQSGRLVLNGMGLREKFWVDVYVAGLYLTEKESNPQRIISARQPKRIHTKFIFPSVPKKKMQDTLSENLSNNPDISDKTQVKIKQCLIMMEDFSEGDEIIFDYAPNLGTTIFVKGTNKGTIKGDDFMEAIFSIYLGSQPASEDLKHGLLGVK